MKKKILLTLFYALIAVLIYAFHSVILDWIHLAENNHIPLVAALATLMSLFPVIPYPLVGGVIGAAYGPVIGGLIVWFGSTMASVLMFFFIRYGYQDWGVRLLERYPRVRQLHVLFEKNAFMALLFARMIPIIPSIIINVYAGFSRVHWLVYVLASSLGKVPAMLLFATVGDQALSEPRSILFSIMVYALFLGVVYVAYRRWQPLLAPEIKKTLGNQQP